jgi:hypothetical protein
LYQYALQVKARGARVYVITDNPKLARGIDDNPIVIPDNGPLTALIAVLPLQVRSSPSSPLPLAPRMHLSDMITFFSLFSVCACS